MFAIRPSFHRSLLVGAVSFLGLGLMPAHAIDVLSGPFEVDGNTSRSSADDWQNVVGTSGNGGSASTNTGIIQDEVPPLTSESVFAGGGSKDILDINQWQYSQRSSPDKDDIADAFAAAYQVSVPGDTVNPVHLVVYFGADRIAVNGNAQMGFWFFTGNVSPKTLNGSSAGFNGVHGNNDLLVQINFLNGGVSPDMLINRWQNGTLQQLAHVTGSNFSACTAGNSACVTANGSPTPAYWTYSPKSGTAGLIPMNGFFEGGIDVTALLGTTPCFASFMAETRSAQSFTAVLKDLALGAFPVCGLSVGKACAGTPSVNSDGLSIHTTFAVPIRNTGLASIANVSVREDAALDPNHVCRITAVDSSAVGPIALTTGTPVQVKASLAGSATTTVTIECDTTDNPFINSVTALASTGGGTLDLSAAHTVDPAKGEACSAALSPSLSLTKTCKGVSINATTLLPQVCVDIAVTSTTTEKLLGVTVSDDKIGTLLTNGTLLPGATQTLSNQCYTPTATDGDVTTPCLITFSDHAAASATGALSGQVANAIASATCKLCDCPAQ